MSDIDETPECPVCGEHCETLHAIIAKSKSDIDHTKFTNELDVWDTWDDEGGSIPPESE